VPLLEGLDGVQKMSKSLGNYVGIDESPGEMFGKIMSISDDLMWRYFDLLSFRPKAEVDAFKAEIAEGRNPRDVKFELGREVVARFHDAAAAAAAQAEFVARFQKGALPEDMPEVAIACEDGTVGIADVLRQAQLTGSNSEAFRMLKQGAVKVDGEKVVDRGAALGEGTYVVQVGKRRVARVVLD
jgi:tyrosyl-tRNA synthetase